MSQKELIINLLKEYNALTQGQLAKKIYGDNVEISRIYASLMKLVNDGVVERRGSQPAYYSLSGSNVEIFATQSRRESKKSFVPVEINNQTIEEVDKLVLQTDNYGKEDALITSCLKQFSNNCDLNAVAMKIGLIDITNSTNIARYKRFISVVELAKIITSIPNIDERIKNGDPEIVNIIAKANGKINLFSFASKYCCYHNKNLYGKDDYSIFDTVLKETLPKYFSDVSKREIQRWKATYNYKAYNDYITKKLDELNITIHFRKRKFDHFIWFQNR